MIKEDLYTALYPEFAPKLEKMDISFEEQFNAAYSLASGKPNVEGAIRSILTVVLDEYAATKPKKGIGKVFRWISRVASIVLPFLKKK